MTSPLTLDALLALAERAAGLKRDAEALGLSTSADFFGVPRAIFDVLPHAEAEQRLPKHETWTRAAMYGGARVTFFCDQPPGTLQAVLPAQAGDICADCAQVGLPGALCPHHAAAGIRNDRHGGEAVVVLRGPVTRQGQVKDLTGGGVA